MCFNQGICWGTEGSRVVYLMVNPSTHIVSRNYEWGSQGGLITCKLHKGWLVQSNFGKEIKTQRYTHIYGYRPNDLSAKNMEVYWSKKQSFNNKFVNRPLNYICNTSRKWSNKQQKVFINQGGEELWGKLTDHWWLWYKVTVYTCIKK